MEAIQISLAAARVNANLTQRDVSKLMGVTTNTIVNWEAGRSEPSVSQARELSELYNMPLDNIKIFLNKKSN